MTERQIFKKYDNLSKDELNTKNNKNVYIRNDAMATIFKRSRDEKKRLKKNRWIQKKTNDSRI